ncbi:regulator of G-protein signaling 17-like [Lacerta agilis]|uniref:regulator of G-protein signaling 17-like n=1 Tax=Lacerta agilis TaxID=80427 RepID=UPI001419317B|nr:regulator of G-protein signaling 17-like [Lacerta agilis]
MHPSKQRWLTYEARNRLARKRWRDGVGCKVSSISNLESPLNLEERLTAEEAASWQWSFDSILTSPAGRRIFMEFLQTEHSEENMSFWLACEDLKLEQCPEQISEKAKKIYLDYISILSPKEVGWAQHWGVGAELWKGTQWTKKQLSKAEHCFAAATLLPFLNLLDSWHHRVCVCFFLQVSIDAAVRETINNSLPSPGAHMFDEAQAQVYALMHRDSYPRFLKSPLYKSLEQRLCQLLIPNPNTGTPGSVLKMPSLQTAYCLVTRGLWRVEVYRTICAI